MGLYDTTKSLASAWVEGTKRRLQARGRPNTRVDSGGTQGSYSFDGQEISRSELRDVKEMRESGGIVSHLVHAKSMMQFGTGADFEAENDEASSWLHEQFQDLDNLLIDLGEDATWFPYSLAEIVETQTGDFSHVELVEPWTTLPIENEVGEVIAWEQQIKGDFGSEAQTFEPDEIASFVLNKSSGRDKTGVSEVLRAEDEITHFKENQKVMNDALQYLVPHHHWIIGSEGQTVIDDNELRRFRNRIDNLKGDTQIISGPGVKHEQIDLPKFDIKEITNNDLRQLCVALGVPIELASVISEGLGSGEQSSARQVFFDLEKEAKQRALGGQFVEQIARILLRDYSTFDHEQELDLVFRNARTAEERKQVVDAIGEDLTVNERRSLFEYAELDDEEEGEAFQSPGQEDEQGESPFGGPGGGFFSDGRQLQSVPDNATSIDSPDECDGNVIEGPQGGMYCVPSGGDGEGEDGGGGNMTIEEVEPGDEVVVDAEIEGPDGEMVDISDDEIDVLDVDPSFGMLIDHPEHGRGEVPVDAINGITDPDAEGTTDEGGTQGDGPPNSVEGLDIDDTVEGSETILSDEEKERVEDRLTEAHGESAGEALDLSNMWRQNSISGAAETLATGLKEVGGLDGDVRDSGREADDPDPEQLEVLEDMVDMSQDFFEEKFGEETELVRGTRENSRDDFLMSVFGGEESVEINANAVDNYTSEEELAENYAGGDGLVLRPTVTSDDVQLANASLFAEGFEDQGDEYLIDSPNEITPEDAEVRIGGDSITVASEPTDMSQDDFRTLAAEMEDAPEELRTAFEEWAGDLA